jgi:hypothetical protein
MKHGVLKDFFDKNTGEFHAKGSEYETKTTKRAKELQDKGFLNSDEQPNE